MSEPSYKMFRCIYCTYLIFLSLGYAVDPTVDTQNTSQPSILGDAKAAEENKGIIFSGPLGVLSHFV